MKYQDHHRYRDEDYSIADENRDQKRGRNQRRGKHWRDTAEGRDRSDWWN